MKTNLKTTINDLLTGKPIDEAKSFIIQSLNYPDHQVDDQVRRDRYNLAKEVVASDEFDFTDGQKTDVLNLIRRTFPAPMIYCQLEDLLKKTE